MEKIATQLGVYQDISHASYTLRAARLFRCVCVWRVSMFRSADVVRAAIEQATLHGDPLRV